MIYLTKQFVARLIIALIVIAFIIICVWATNGLIIIVSALVALVWWAFYYANIDDLLDKYVFKKKGK